MGSGMLSPVESVSLLAMAIGLYLI